MFRTDEFSFSVGLIENTLALSSSLPVARGAFNAAKMQYPDRELTLRQGCRIITEQEAKDG